jgi:hypothetical protein
MLAGVGLDLDYQRLFGLAGSQAIASIEDEIGLVQLTRGDRSQPLVRAAYLQLHRVCRHLQAIRRQSCAHTFSAEIALIEPKNPLFSMRQPSRARPNMPTDRKLGYGQASSDRGRVQAWTAVVGHPAFQDQAGPVGNFVCRRA